MDRPQSINRSQGPEPSDPMANGYREADPKLSTLPKPKIILLVSLPERLYCQPHYSSFVERNKERVERLGNIIMALLTYRTTGFYNHPPFLTVFSLSFVFFSFLIFIFFSLFPPHCLFSNVKPVHPVSAMRGTSMPTAAPHRPM